MTKKEDTELRRFYKNIPIEHIHRAIFNCKFSPSKKPSQKSNYKDPATGRLIYFRSDEYVRFLKKYRPYGRDRFGKVIKRLHNHWDGKERRVTFTIEQKKERKKEQQRKFNHSEKGKEARRLYYPIAKRKKLRRDMAGSKNI